MYKFLLVLIFVQKNALQLAEGSKVRICRVLPPLWLVGETDRKDGECFQVF